jgi:hypothetical protein
MDRNGNCQDYAEKRKEGAPIGKVSHNGKPAKNRENPAGDQGEQPIKSARSLARIRNYGMPKEEEALLGEQGDRLRVQGATPCDRPAPKAVSGTPNVLKDPTAMFWRGSFQESAESVSGPDSLSGLAYPTPTLLLRPLQLAKRS